MPSSTSKDLCLVCQDVSTGYHYGVPSCNGWLVYLCFYCFYRLITHFALLHKILISIQQNRDPIGYTKRTRRYRPFKNSPASTEYSLYPQYSSPLNGNSIEKPNEDRLLDDLSEIEKKCTAIRNSKVVFERSLIDLILSPCTLQHSAFIESLTEHRHSYSSLRQATSYDYQYWHERDWIVMVEWAKAIPVYEALPVPDKLALLRNSAITFPSLQQCFYSPDQGLDTIVFPNGAFYDRTPEPHRPFLFQKRKYRILDQLLRPMRKLNLDVSEFSAFKAIFFLNPDADDLSPIVKEAISDCRSSITNALYRYMAQRKGVEEAADRLSRLLLMGTVLATMAVEMKEAIVMADFFNQVQFSSFAKQIFFGIQNEDNHFK
ncbi:unnamed protein product [Anisakis simplex]|uniref:NR LBD domain-containing protein n=1 Tax=Anisakis simplex TaxID=6269 RepID=A0A3P6RBN6_ANISI|nr:unnamed protein product [Anisakis simplex]